MGYQRMKLLCRMEKCGLGFREVRRGELELEPRTAVLGLTEPRVETFCHHPIFGLGTVRSQTMRQMPGLSGRVCASLAPCGRGETPGREGFRNWGTAPKVGLVRKRP